MSKEAIKYITATLAAFGPDEAISMTKETWSKLREAIKTLAEQPARQEPVAFYVYKPTLPRGNLGSVSDGDLPWVYDQDSSSGFSARMLVTPITSPPTSKPWVELTDEEIAEQDWRLSAARTYEQWTLQEQLVVCGEKDFARAIEAKLKEKNA